MQISETAIAQGRAEERIFYGWVVVGILFFISLIDGGFGYLFSAFLKPLAEEFGWTHAQTSGAFSLYLLAHRHGLILTPQLLIDEIETKGRKDQLLSPFHR